LKVAGLVVVAVLAAIGTATAIDTGDQLDQVSSCLRDASLRVERDDLEYSRVRGGPVVIPGIGVQRAPSGDYVAGVLFYSDDFEAEKVRPNFAEGGPVEQLENVLILTGGEASAEVDSVRECVRRSLPGRD
jgi:hypothetical protein